ncbi:type II toxin-antitoxin system VapC family toxin [Halovivax limisalsi]|uniref:type II toxin-antitoxin system VapC family toxin n=1 Tax=Halovivax limisalsi TaxID=1453760 RepID=UPI001FFCE809|nr:type II toxin-antitoxin system VapC family toxin [Halovivax limisalsi]
MNCLDTNVLIDYLEGDPAVGAFIEAHESVPMFAPVPALFEVFIGASRLRGETGIERARSDLDWLEPVPLTIGGAAEAARIDAELHASGEPIDSLDTLIAGVAREAGATVVTRDGHFERVENLDVELID